MGELKDTNCVFFEVAFNDIYDKYIGETEKRMSSLFDHVRSLKCPSIIFIGKS